MTKTAQENGARSKQREKWDARKHQPTKTEMEEKIQLPGATPEKLVKALIDYNPRKD